MKTACFNLKKIHKVGGFSLLNDGGFSLQNNGGTPILGPEGKGEEGGLYKILKQCLKFEERLEPKLQQYFLSCLVDAST